MQYHKILSKKNLNHNVILIEIESLGLAFPTSSFVYIYDDKNNCRPYTPIRVSTVKAFTPESADTALGIRGKKPSDNVEALLFAIKVYPNGTLSPYINSLNIGDKLKLGPVISKLDFDEKWKHVLMIAGGTGITPMLQIIESQKQSKFVVVFCNLTIEDVFLTDRLLKDNIEVIHVIEKASTDGRENNCRNVKANHHGRINKEILAEILSGRDSFDKVFVCGPDGMMEAVCGKKNLDKTQGELKGILKDLGFSSDLVYKF
ncbi:NADH-cytochrome b5 reductase 2 [Dictyocoela roeselum]|nr:NADH-cytochrome b5 reductase 2 [Dictyocoela roeselum]